MEIKKILIVKVGAIGDILMATPAIRAIKKRFPSAELTLLIGASVKDVVKGNPYIDDLIEIDDKTLFKGSSSGKALLLGRLIKRLRKEKYALSVILHRDWRYGLVMKLAGIPERIGFERPHSFLTKGASINGKLHHIKHYLEVARLCGAQADGTEMDFTVSDEARESVSRRLDGAGCGDGRLIGISPGGARNLKEVMDTRRWSADSYKELAARLARHGLKVMLFGAKSDLWFLRDWSIPEGVTSFIGETTLEETAGLMERCSVVVTHDSGPMHLASAVRTPVVSVFGPTDPREKYPLNRGSFYFWKVEGLECAPCYEDGVFPDCRTMKCMKATAVDDVYEKVIESISKN